MTDDLASQALLADVGRQRRRTRRLVDSNWFTFAVLGAALTIGGVVPDGWGWAFGGAMVAAYLAIGLRWRHVARTFSWRADSVSIQWGPAFLGLAIGGGDWALSAQLPHAAEIVAVSAWTSLGVLGFWWMTRMRVFLAMAVVAVGVGALQLVLDTDDTALYGVAYLLLAGGYWLWLGRRSR